ncbi:glycosyltransferase family A protein [Marmoricola sp. RAF53]|uniref:glycosyltransferase family A protein n=1 Tax=Marmoricola sp. RAF53 TaxID=3233059 RepID=UPI003F9C28FF
MTAGPPLTVVIPTRDRLDLLRRAVDSVWDQDYTGDLHLVVVFDSDLPDEPDLPAPRHPERQRLSVLRNAGTPGSSGVRNYAFGLVETAWFATCDDDDVWLPHRLSSQVAALARPGETPVAIGAGLRIVRRGAYTVRRPPLTEVTFADLLADRVMELHPSVLLLNRDAVAAAGCWDERIPGSQGEDYDLLLRLSRRGRVVLVDEVVADISWEGQSFFFGRWRMTADALRYLLAKYPEFAASPRGRARVLGQIGFAEAACGRRRTALRAVRAAFADNPREPRIALTLAVVLGLARASWIQGVLHARGRGI